MSIVRALKEILFITTLGDEDKVFIRKTRSQLIVGIMIICLLA